MVINDFLAAVLTVDIHLDHARIKRTGTIQRTHGDDVFDVGRLQFCQIFFHAHTF